MRLNIDGKLVSHTSVHELDAVGAVHARRHHRVAVPCPPIFVVQYLQRVKVHLLKQTLRRDGRAHRVHSIT
jgi:hypothetical protein